MPNPSPFHIANKPLRVSYEIPEQVTDFLVKGEISYGVENDNFSVEIKQYRYDEYLAEYLSTPLFAAKQLANDMEVALKHEGHSWEMQRGNAAYIVCEDSYDDEIPPHKLVFLVIFDPQYKLVYEITIDCYAISVADGVSIAESFNLLP